MTIDLQIERETTFRHLEAVVNKSTVLVDVEHVIMSLGITSQYQIAKDTTVKQLQAALRAARHKF